MAERDWDIQESAAVQTRWDSNRTSWDDFNLLATLWDLNLVTEIWTKQ